MLFEDFIVKSSKIQLRIVDQLQEWRNCFNNKRCDIDEWVRWENNKELE